MYLPRRSNDFLTCHGHVISELGNQLEVIWKGSLSTRATKGKHGICWKEWTWVKLQMHNGREIDFIWMLCFCAISNCVHAFQNWPVATARYTLQLFPLCWIILQKPDDQYQSFNLRPLWPILGSFIVLKIHMQNIDRDFTVEKQTKKGFHSFIYGSLSAGREKWPFNVIFF